MDKLVDSFLRYPSLPLLFGAGAVYTAYYYSFVAKVRKMPVFTPISPLCNSCDGDLDFTLDD